MSSLPRAFIHLPLVSHPPIQVATFDMIRQPYAIDAARVVTVAYTVPLLRELESSSPIVLTWGSYPNVQRMHGYVYSVRPMADALTRAVEIIITGIQSPMASYRRDRTFKSMGPHNVAAQIVDEYRMHLRSKPQAFVDTYEQSNINDWQFLSDVARNSGYLLMTRGMEILFAPLMWFWEWQLRHQTEASTFRNTTTPRANLASFTEDEAEFRPALEEKTSPFGTAGDFTRQTAKFWEGAVTGDLFRSLFPHTASAKVLGPYNIYPMDAYDITTGVKRSTWSALQVIYRLTPEDYYATVHFGGNGILYPNSTDPKVHDVSAALHFRAMQAPEPQLVNFKPVYAGAQKNFYAHWESGMVHSPETEEAMWLR